MPTLLHVTAAADAKLSHDFVETWTKSHHAVAVRTLDLAAERLSGIAAAAIADMNKPAAEQSAEAKAAITLSDKYIADLEWAKVVVIGATIDGLALPPALDTWLSLVRRFGRTLKDTGFGRSKGLLHAKKLFALLSGRGVEPALLDTHEATLRERLGGIGYVDMTVIRDTGAPLKTGAYTPQQQISMLAG